MCFCSAKLGCPLPNPCQHLGGINIVERIMESLLDVGAEGDSYVAMLDLLGYDAWPAQYALIQSAAGWVPIHFWIWFNVFTRLLKIVSYFDFQSAMVLILAWGLIKRNYQARRWHVAQRATRCMKHHSAHQALRRRSTAWHEHLH